MKKFNFLDAIISPTITEKATALSEYNKIVFKVHNKATKNFPRHRCARCGRNLSIGQRRDIVVDGKKLGMSFCQRCATDMVKE